MNLSAAQQAVLCAAIDRIIPADDYPGASEAGVLNYLARQFATDLRSLLPVYREGLDALEAEALAAFGQGFATLTDEEQDSLLARVEAGEVTTEWSTPPQKFFRLIVNHTAEGYYGDPGNGGNQGGVSWRLIGFEE